MPEFSFQTLWVERLLDAPEQSTSLPSLLWVCHVAYVAGSLSCRPRLEMEVGVTVGLATPYPGLPSQHPVASLGDSEPHPLSAPAIPREEDYQAGSPQTPDTPRRTLPKTAGRRTGAPGGREHRARSRPVFLGKCLPRFLSVLGREEVVCPLPKGQLK